MDLGELEFEHVEPEDGEIHLGKISLMVYINMRDLLQGQGLTLAWWLQQVSHNGPFSMIWFSFIPN